MRRHHLRRSLAASAATALLLSLAACGGDDAGTASDEPASESESSDGAETADQPAEGETVDNAEFVDDMMSGLEASTTAKISMAMDVGGGGKMDMDGEVDYTTDPPSMAVEMSQEAMGEQAIEMVLVDGMMYMNMGQMTNDKFVEFDLSDPASLPPGMDALGDQLDPLAAFEEFEPALKTVTFVGTEDVDGEELHHYDVVMETAKLKSLEDVPAEAEMPAEVDYDFWFDDEFRIRQMEMVMDMATPVSVEAQLFDWDEPVEIEAPPAGQIAEQPSA